MKDFEDLIACISKIHVILSDDIIFFIAATPCDSVQCYCPLSVLSHIHQPLCLLCGFSEMEVQPLLQSQRV